MKDELINEGCQLALKQLFFYTWFAGFIEFSKVNEFSLQNSGKTM